MNLNLPNTITAGRILAAPFIAALPFIASPGARLAAFDSATRPRAFGLWAASTSALTLLGPILGGLLVDNASWRVALS